MEDDKLLLQLALSVARDLRVEQFPYINILG